MKRKKRVFRRRGPEHRINHFIEAQELRLVGDNIDQGVYQLSQALQLAREQGLDLVEISPKAIPPVCRIIDYNKFLYDQKKKKKEIKAKAVKTTLKEIRFTPHTDDHDFDFKAKHAEKFLSEGSKVKAYVQFRGRSIVFKEQGEVLLLKFAQRLEDHGMVETMPKLEGKRMHILIAPGKIKKSSSKPDA